MRSMVWNRPPPRPALRSVGLCTWEGETPTVCDLCPQKIRSVFVYGSVKHDTEGVMCLNCHRTRGEGVGDGRGVVFTRRASDNKFVGQLMTKVRK